MYTKKCHPFWHECIHKKWLTHYSRLSVILQSKNGNDSIMFGLLSLKSYILSLPSTAHLLHTSNGHSMSLWVDWQQQDRQRQKNNYGNNNDDKVVPHACTVDAKLPQRWYHLQVFRRKVHKCTRIDNHHKNAKAIDTHLFSARNPGLQTKLLCKNSL